MSNIGVKTNTPKKDTLNIKIMNQMIIAAIAIVFTGLIQDFFIQGFIQICADIAYLSILFLCIYLNYVSRYNISKLVFQIIYPIAILVIIIWFGSEIRAESLFFIFLISAILFYHELKCQVVAFLYVSFMWILSEYIMTHFEAFMSVPHTFWDTKMSEIATVICIILMLRVYKTETEKKTIEIKNTLQEKEKQNIELNLANAELERFAHVASHDLKTPLRNIVSFTNLIERKIAKKEYENLSEYLKFVQEGGKQMNRLISEILEFSKLSINSQIEMSEFDVKEIVQNINQKILSYTVEQNATIEVISEQNLVVSNHSLLEILLQNLIENGIKYNKAIAKKIVIECMQTAQKTIITISDNGIGIDPEYHENIFVLFTRLHDDQSFSGSGMGLAICKKIVDRLQGQISVSSVLEKGSVFIIELPLKTNS